MVTRRFLGKVYLNFITKKLLKIKELIVLWKITNLGIEKIGSSYCEVLLKFITIVQR